MGETKSNFTADRIKLLPAFLIDQIKAGEVIERPASLLKELIENSIDAKASSISISIRDNGLGQILIQDNGHGMTFHDMPWAFTRHATSKIKNFDDLYRLKSFGFRGEALASAASIARIVCTTSQAQNGQPPPHEGGRLTLEAGRTLSHEKFISHSGGTTIDITDLFFNTPARLKFIQSKVTEKNQLKKIFHFFLLAYPHIEFSIRWDDDDKKIYKAHNNGDYKKRFQEIIFSKKEQNTSILEINGDYEQHFIKGYISKNSQRGNSNKTQLLFVNGRIFFDKALHQIIIKSLSASINALWPPDQTGHYLLFFNVPTDLIDVNIHPHKTQVKFFQYGMLQSLLSSTIKKETAPPLSELSTSRTSEFNQCHSSQNNPSHEDDLRPHLEMANSLPLREYQAEYQVEYLNHNKNFHHVIPITSRFFLKKDAADKYLIDTHHELKQFILNQLVSDIKITPLLISEPVATIIKNKNAIELINLLGFELEELREHFYVFRGYPDALNPSSYKSFFYFFLNIIQENNISELQQLYGFIHSMDMSSESFNLSIPEYEMIEIIQKNKDTRSHKISNIQLDQLFTTLLP